MKDPEIHPARHRAAWIVPAVVLLGLVLVLLSGPPSAEIKADGGSGTAAHRSGVPSVSIGDRIDEPGEDAGDSLDVADAESWKLIADRRQKDARAEAGAGAILPADFLNRAVTGKAIAFTLPDGTDVVGEVEMIGHDDMGVLYVQAKIHQPAEGVCFIQRQTAPGVAGPLVGHVRFADGDTAWKIEPTADLQSARFVQRDIDEVVCVNYTKLPDPAEGDGAERIPQNHPTDIPIPPYQDIIPLQSLPGAVGVLYLDFDGEEGPFPPWGDFDAAHSGANNAQVFDVWKMVCEDFQGFNLNITTDRKVFDAAPPGRRQHIIITPTNTAAPGAGGVAYVGSYNWTNSTVCWAFYSTGKTATEVISHELGHTLNLYHHGTTTGSEYYGGHGGGATGWAPIMGVGYYQTLSQWSKGEYANANRPGQNDLLIIANNNNNVGYRPDDTGHTLETARYLDIFSGGGVSNEGILETTGDLDGFRFRTSGGQATISVNTVTLNPNLDLYAEIVRASDLVVVASDNQDLQINASLSASLAAGEYLLRVRGTGRGDPLVDGYTNYGCVGSYVISGNVAGGVHADHAAIAENSANGTTVATVAPRNNHGGATLAWAITSGNTSGAFAINSATGQISVANSSALDYEALSSRWDDPADFELFVSITSASNPSLNESIRVVVGVTDVNESPSMADGEIAFSEGVSAGTVVGQVAATDPDRFDYLVFSIVSGDPGGLFAMDPASGEIRTTTHINIRENKIYPLLVRVEDQAEPPHVVTATYTIRITNVNGQEAEIIVTCDNGYELYVNGTLRGSGSNWQQAGRHTVPLVDGANAIAVKGTDAGGIASMIAQITTGGVRSGTSNLWKASLTGPAGWTQAGFDDSAWGAATETGAYGISPWGTGVANMPSDTPARWIWSSDTDAHNLVYFRHVINVEPQPDNNPPVIAQGDVAHVTMSKDANPVPFVLTLNASDANGDALSWSVSSPASHGAAVATGTGSSKSIGYTPSAGYAGSDSFVVSVSDGNGGVDTILVSVVIQDKVPGLLAEFFDYTTSLSSLPDLTSKTPDVTRIDAKIEYPSTSSAWTGLPASMAETFASRHTGFVQITTPGTYTFYLESDDGSKLWLNGQLLVNNDGLHGMQEASGGVSLAAGLHVIRVEFFENGGGAGLVMRWSGPGIAKQVVPTNVLFTPGEGNRKPVAIAQNVTATQGVAKNITLAGSDADGDPLSFSIVSQPAHGTLGGTPPNVTYTPSVGYSGGDSFVFKTNDGTTDSDPATVSITVSPNTAPVAIAQSVATAYEVARLVTLAGSDADGNPLTFSIVSQPQHGSLTGTPPSVTYTPAAGYIGNDAFTFKVNDGLADSAPAAVTISVEEPGMIVPVYATRDDGKTVATFTSGSGMWRVPNGVTSVEVLVVGGGGAGGGQSSGGGAGGFYQNTSHPVTPGALVSVSVGSGGTGGNGGPNAGYSYHPGNSGNRSEFGSLIAYGGVFGGSYGAGGAQGGHSTDGGTTIVPGKSGGGGVAGNYGAGGGAGAPGGNSNSSAGGVGVQNAITGTLKYYAGGGGANPGGLGGLGGGGSGVAYTSSNPSDMDGVDGLGGGGGGGWGGVNNGADGGGDGGDGVVIIAYQQPDPGTPYESWADQYRGHDLTDPLADIDGDGVDNFHEFAFGLDPTNGGSSNPVVSGPDKATHRFSYTRLAASGLDYTVLSSGNLSDWGPAAVRQEVVGAPDANGVVTVEVTLNPPAEGDNLFIRVKAD